MEKCEAKDVIDWRATYNTVKLKTASRSHGTAYRFFGLHQAKYYVVTHLQDAIETGDDLLRMLMPATTAMRQAQPSLCGQSRLTIS